VDTIRREAVKKDGLFVKSGTGGPAGRGIDEKTPNKEGRGNGGGFRSDGPLCNGGEISKKKGESPRTRRK